MISRKEQLLTMLEAEPKDIFIIYALGMEALAEQDYVEALKRFKEVIVIDPSHHPAYYQLALLYQTLDIIDVAKSYADKGKQIAQSQNNHKATNEFKALIERLNE